VKSLIGRTIARKYIVRDVLGRGANAVVYEALDVKMTRPVAIKVPTFGGLDPEQILRRFKREVRASASIAHPNVCGTHDAGQLDDGTPFLVTERLEGESLAGRLHREGPLTLEHAIVIFSQVLSALAAAHARRIIHRDVKPENIFLAHVEGYEDLVKVLDFGASKRFRSAHDSDGAVESGGDLTAAGFVFGTPQYMAPEQIRNQAVTPQVDIFACGASLFEALTGERLYRSHSPDEIFREILSLPARTVRTVMPSLPFEVDEVVRKALRRNPEFRYATAFDFQKALKGLAPLARSSGSMRLVSTGENDSARRLSALKQQFHELAGRHRATREQMTEEREALNSSRPPPLPSIVEEDPDGTRTTERRNVSPSVLPPSSTKSRPKKPR
jgi:serine/threonine-protein kinase